MCECYQIGGPFIDVDPDCQEHGIKRRRLCEEYESSPTWDQIYHAWLAVGADIAGLNWNDFVEKINVSD